MSTQVPSSVTKPVETSMPGLASSNPVESTGCVFLSSTHVAPPSVEVRCGISIRPGQALNEFGNMCSTPSFSMTAPGLMYRSSVPASFVSTTLSLSKTKRWVTAGGGVGVISGVARLVGAADGAVLATGDELHADTRSAISAIEAIAAIDARGGRACRRASIAQIRAGSAPRCGYFQTAYW